MAGQEGVQDQADQPEAEANSSTRDVPMDGQERVQSYWEGARFHFWFAIGIHFSEVS